MVGIPKVRRWPTLRIALMYGLPFGAIVEAIRLPSAYWSLDSELLGYVVGAIGGGAIGGALMFGLVCGVRNLLLGLR